MVAVGPPLLQPKSAFDEHVYVACLVAADSAAPAGAGQQQLLVRLQADTSSSSGAGLAAEALLMQLPQGLSAASWAFYKDQQLALLLHDPTTCKSPSVVSPTRFDSSSTTGSSGSSSLHLLQLSDAPWAAVTAVPLLSQQQQQQQGWDARQSVLAQCVAAGAVVAMDELQSRSRVLQQGRAGQLAVGRSRGLGSLMTDMQHLLLLDLEEDEETGEDEVSEGDDDMQEN
jgi:hypothetical protein